MGSQDEFPFGSSDYSKQLTSPQKTIDLYESLAETYDDDLAKKGYNAPANTMPLCLQYLQKTDRILDVGAGTGIMGFLLKEAGFTNIDGLDPAKGMLDIAKEKNVYKKYLVELFNEEFCNQTTTKYDAVLCVGAVAPGHLTPKEVSLMTRLVNKGGKVIIGMRKVYLGPLPEHPNWPEDLTSVLQRLEDDGTMNFYIRKLNQVFCQDMKEFTLFIKCSIFSFALVPSMEI